jgi:hypothetical protein
MALKDELVRISFLSKRSTSLKDYLDYLAAQSKSGDTT